MDYYFSKISLIKFFFFFCKNISKILFLEFERFMFHQRSQCEHKCVAMKFMIFLSLISK